MSLARDFERVAAMVREQPVAMVTLAAVEGSAPREAGTKMFVTASETMGTIGGGNLEMLAINQARRLLGQDEVALLQQDYPLGPLLAQCCGGHVRLLIERLDADAGEWLAQAAGCERSGGRYSLEATIDAGRVERTLGEGWSGEPAVTLMDASGRIIGRKDAWLRIIEHVSPQARELVLFGAGHVGRAVAHIARTLPFDLRWIEQRAEFAGEAELCADPVAVVNDVRPGTFFLVITHAHELDYRLVKAILARGDAGFCGLIGSKTKRARFVSRLGKDGVSAAGLVCPVGAGRIRSKDPACIAVAIAGELLERLEARSAAIVERAQRA